MRTFKEMVNESQPAGTFAKKRTKEMQKKKKSIINEFKKSTAFNGSEIKPLKHSSVVVGYRITGKFTKTFDVYNSEDEFASWVTDNKRMRKRFADRGITSYNDYANTIDSEYKSELKAIKTLADKVGGEVLDNAQSYMMLVTV